ncbi:MAG: hypothetical protein SGJ27_17145 [Candidatus Melainabacteria bacterium]|mgnify:CR=1 FL=1|nr:hypothetical protein [Candidatus Melainabacteria bacterium]
MEIARDRRAGAKRIGELLVAAGVIRQEVLLEALQIAKKSSTPVGRVLLTIGELSERDLLAAIEIQSMLRENLISNEFGIRALSVCITGKVPLEEAFRRLGFKPPAEREVVATGELGEILISAGVITPPILEECLRQSEDNNLPLGRCLVLARAVSSNLLTSALTAQVLVRDGKITYEQAVAGLQAAHRKQQTIEQSLSETGAMRVKVDERYVKVGDLLTKAGLLSESDKVSAIEKGLVENIPVGQVFVQLGLISPSVLEETLKLQRLVGEGQITSLQAAEVLRQANARGVPVDVITNERSYKTQEVEALNRLLILVRKAELIGPTELQRAEIISRDLKMTLGEVILSKDMIPQKLIEATGQAKKLMDDGIVTEKHAIKILSFCRRSGVAFSEALKSVPPDHDVEDYDEPEEPEEESKSDFLGGIFGMFNKKK